MEYKQQGLPSTRMRHDGAPMPAVSSVLSLCAYLGTDLGILVLSTLVLCHCPVPTQLLGSALSRWEREVMFRLNKELEE